MNFLYWLVAALVVICFVLAAGWIGARREANELFNELVEEIHHRQRAERQFRDALAMLRDAKKWILREVLRNAPL